MVYVDVDWLGSKYLEIFFVFHFPDVCSLFPSSVCFTFILLFSFQVLQDGCLDNWDFSSFLIYAFSALNFPFSTGLVVIHNSWWVVVSFPFGSVHFSISLETSSLNHGLCRRRLVSIQVFGNFLCCSVTQSCPALCYPMDCCMLGFPVIYHLP